MNARWRLRPHDPARILGLSRAAGLSPLVAQLLINRGIDEPEQAVLFLEARLGSLSDPELIPGAVDAADRIVRAIRDDRKIVVYGDYDVDGVCGTSILWTCLRLAGATDAEYYIPHRVEEGYGVNAEALRRLAREHKASLIVTVDCGISAVREAELARELGVELDHHRPPHDRLDAPSGRRDRPSALAGWSGCLGRPLRRGRGIQAGLAGLQELRRWQARLASPPRLSCPLAGTGRPGDDRRHRAALRRESGPGSPRTGRYRSGSDRRPPRADGSERFLEQAAIDDRHGRFWAGSSNQRRRPARARHDGRRVAHDR